MTPAPTEISLYELKTNSKLKRILTGLLVLFFGVCAAPVFVILIDLSAGYIIQGPAEINSEKTQLIKNLFFSISKKAPTFYAVNEPANSTRFREMLVLPFDYRDYSAEPQPGFPRYDNNKRRLSLSPLNKNQKNHFNLFFGGSFLYGDGVTDEFTLPSQIQAGLANYESYNYCIDGGSSVHALTLASRRQLASQVSQKSGTVFFEITGSSFGRVRGTPANSSWLKDLPYVEINSAGQLGLKGTLEEASPIYWFLINWIRLSVFSKILNMPENDWDEFFPDRTQLLCQIIVETKKIISEQLQVEDFYVLGYGLKQESKIAMSSCLEKSGIKLNVLRMVKFDHCVSSVRAAHPSEVAHAETASYMIHNLNLWPSAKKISAPNLNFSCVVAGN